MEQSANQTTNPNNDIDVDVCVHTYSPLRAVAVKTVHFQNVCENYHGNVNGCIFNKFTEMEVKYKIAIYNKILK